MSFPLKVKYSIPFVVDAITEIKEVIACFNDFDLIPRIPVKNLNDSSWVILNMSLRISY